MSLSVTNEAKAWQRRTPPEMELEIQWQEHDLGTYPLIELVWEDATRRAPWEYIEKCEAALTEYDTR